MVGLRENQRGGPEEGRGSRNRGGSYRGSRFRREVVLFVYFFLTSFVFNHCKLKGQGRSGRSISGCSFW